MPEYAGLSGDERERLLAEFAPDHLPWLQLYDRLVRRLGQTVGRQALEAILQEFAGQNTYVPVPEHFYERLRREWRNEKIRAEFRGNNLEDLAERWQLHPKHVHRIVHGRPSRAKE